MATERTQFMGVGFMGRSPNVTAQTRKNVYLDLQPEGEKTRVTAHPTPGLENFADLGATPVRGMHTFNDNIYVVHRGIFYAVNNAGVAINKGTLDTTEGRCSIDDNGVEIIVVDGQFGYIYTLATESFDKIVDGDFSTTPQTVAFNGGYFLITERDTGQFKICGLYDGAAWNSLDFATAESASDYLVRVEEDSGNIVLFGNATTEFWMNVGDLDFPYKRIAGTDMQWGLAARWSVSKFNNSLMFLGRSRQGEVKVMFLNGYEPVSVSTSDLEKIFNTHPVANAKSFSYMVDGHSMYQINLPTLNRSFLYDGTSEAWSEVNHIGNGRHLGDIGVSFIDNNYVSSYTDGKIYRLKPGVYTDAGSTIIREITGRHFEKGMDYFVVERFILDIQSGVGLATGQGDDPHVMMQYSTDNGHSWSEELLSSFGKAGEYDRYCEWWRLGRGKDFVVRVRISDPVPFVITGAALLVQ